LGFVFSAFSGIQQAILRRNMAFKSLALRNFVATISSGLIAVALAFIGYGVWSLVAKLLSASLINAIALWTVSDWRPGFHFSRKHFNDLFAYGINIVGSNFVNFFSLRGGDFLIGYYLGPTNLGYYTLAMNLLLVMMDFLISVPNTVLYPAFSRLQGEVERVKQSFLEVAQLHSMIAFPIFAGISVTASEIVLLLYGKDWSPSIPVFQILMLIGICRSATYFYSSIIKASGKPSWRLIIWSLAALLNLAGFFLAVKRGIVAVAAVYVLVDFLMIPLYLFVIRRLIQVPVRIHIGKYLPALVSTIAMGLAVIGFRFIFGGKTGLPLSLGLYSLVGVIVYLGMLQFLQPKAIPTLIELYRQTRAGLTIKNISGIRS
jgi:PST family polysaccharide transporter